MWYAVDPPLEALRSLPQAAECTNDAPMRGVEDAELSTCEQVARYEQEKLRNTPHKTYGNQSACQSAPRRADSR